MNNPNPAEELIERLRAQFGGPLSDAAETIVERFLAPFALVPKHDFEAHLQALAALEQDLARLTQRVAELESQAESAPAKKGAKEATKKRAKKKTDQKSAKKTAKKQSGRKKKSDS